ncbi:hypothetical protein EL84_25865 [Paenibacillus sp. VT-400]|uniref:hypothetical protein n=1 Tax=Paenibacillus sp. VT-400 TaxID=1495853 RepID=UPI000649B965|nr:hypothetical protein [Paenibacillus sp. VT-400]KLU55472.1 hypothetical protein EL84_25865 [Paenibacillus sp. VT-400]
MSNQDDQGWDDILDGLKAETSDSSEVASFGTQDMNESASFGTEIIEKGFGHSLEFFNKQNQDGKDDNGNK